MATRKVFKENPSNQTDKPFTIPKEKIYKIIYLFETGKTTPQYDALVVLPDGPKKTKQITYGKLQTTETGNLITLVTMYVNANGKYAKDLKPYLVKINKTPLAADSKFKNLLIKAGKEDKIMQQMQDDFFDETYWKPALRFFTYNKFILPLSMLVIFDSFIQSGQIRKDIRDAFAEKIPRSGGDEKKWTSAYIDARHEWLSNNKNPIVQNTIYRTRCFKSQLESNNWDLFLPVNALDEQVV
jgi:chitosanase